MKRAIVGCVAVVVIVVAGAYLYRRPPAGAMPAQHNTSAAVSYVMPPVVPTRQELLTDVTALQAKVDAAINTALEAKLPERVDRVNRLFDALARLYKEVPREHFDPKAVVQTVGKDPVSLAQWVSASTMLTPYRGTLRGSTGVLMDRMGNSLDRALLLHDLLQAAGRQARLARADVSGATLDTIVEAAERMPTQSGADPELELKAAEIANELGLNAPALQEEQAALRSATEKLAARVIQRAKSQADVLVQTLKPYARSEDLAASSRHALADHWFVQYRDGSTWVSLDPLPGRPSLDALAEPIATMSKNQLPRELHHRIRMRVIAEFWRDGRLETAPLLDHEVWPSPRFGQSVSFRNVPDNWPNPEKIRSASDSQLATLQAAVSQRSWTPMLVVDNRSVAGKTITADGRIFNASSSLDLGFGRLGRTLATGLAAGDGVLTAEWIEYEVTGPSMASETIRRDVFDVLTPEARAQQPVMRPEPTEPQIRDRALALLDEVEVLPVVAQLRPEFVTALHASRLLQLRPRIIKAVSTRPGVPRPVTMPSSAQSLPGVMALAIARQASSDSPNPRYMDRPNILAHWRRMRSNDGTRIFRREDYDIVANHVAARGTDAATTSRIRLEQGVLDTNVEAALAVCIDCEARGNTSDVFAASATVPRPWTALPPKSSLPQSVRVAAEVRERINRASAAGLIVVLPSDMGANGNAGEDIAWWTIDPPTGRTLGIGPDGLGQNTIELITLIDTTFCIAALYTGYSRGTQAVWQSTVGGFGCVAVYQLGIAAVFSKMFGYTFYANLFAVIDALLTGVVGVVTNL